MLSLGDAGVRQVTLENLIEFLRSGRVPEGAQAITRETQHGARTVVTPLSRSGKIRVGWVMHALEELGFRPFELPRSVLSRPTCGLMDCGGDCANCRRLLRDRRNVPAVRIAQGGQLHDLTYWRATPRPGRCAGCGVQDRVWHQVLTVRLARWRDDNRVPAVVDLGWWHSDYFGRHYGDGRSARPLQSGGFETARH